MAIRKVIGTETEFGISIRRQPEFNPALASALVVNSFPGRRIRVQWSYEEESPGRDARGFGVPGYDYSDPDSALVNAVLSNGARFYVDHAHPEYSGPECYDPLEAALHDKVGEAAALAAIRRGQQTLAEGQQLKLYKNNSDGKGNSYGSHENYLLDRATPFGQIVRHLTPFLVTRQIYTGSGKLGSENGRPHVDYQITQRADFFEEQVGLETTLKRPIVNTRDEPHGEPGKYRRLHVIIGDANQNEVQNFLKLGVTALFLAAVEDGALPDAFELADPVNSCWQVSHDLELNRPLELSGRRLGDRARDPDPLSRMAHQVRRVGARRTGLGRRPLRMGDDPRRPRTRPVLLRRPPRLGRQTESRRRLSPARWSRLG